MSHPAHIPPRHAAITLRYDRAEIERAEHELLDAVESHKYPEASKFALRLAFEEAVMNAFRHGHEGLPAETPVRLEWTVGPEHAEISVEDQGPGFKPAEVPDPTLDENLEVPTGRGIMLMRAYMTDVRFNDRGNRITMRYDVAKATRRPGAR